MPEPSPAPLEVDPSDRLSEAIERNTTRWRGGQRLSTGHELYWWVEIGIVMVFDLIYESLRDLNSAGTARAFHNAMRLIDWERDLGLYHEHAWQVFALAHAKWLVIGANYYYGAVYIAVTIAALICLYRRFPDRLPAHAQHAGHRHDAGSHRVRHLPPDAAAAARQLRPPRRLRLRRHPGQVPDLLVVQLVGHEDHLEPVRGHAQPALRVGPVGLRASSCPGSSRGGPRPWPSPTRWRRSPWWSSPPTTTSSTAWAAPSSSSSATAWPGPSPGPAGCPRPAPDALEESRAPV